MKRIRSTANRLLAFAAVAALASCSNDQGLTDPSAPSPDLLLGGLLRPVVEATGLLECRALPPESSSVTIGAGGGTLRVGPHLLVVPPGALDESVTITASILPGTVRGVDLQPDGLEFDRAAVLRMSYDGCNLLGLLLPKHVAYIDHEFNILELLRTLDDLRRRTVTTRLDHFSSYAVAW